MNRSFKDHIIIFLKGIAMGAADVVPGVSGGTIAFISGIYEELLDTINSFNFKAFKIWKEEGLKAVWKSINGNFLVALLAGIGTSVLSLVKLIKWLLENKPVLLWAFFFGLVLASIFFIAKQIKKWNFIAVLMLIAGALIAFYITILPPMSGSVSSNWFMFIAGALAICAMILPGISGSFILLLLGAYKLVFDAIDESDFKTIFILIAGAVTGLLSFSRLLKWLFDMHRNIVLALLTGFVTGSLNKIWPWKEVISWRLNSHGVQVPLYEKNVSPMTYDGDPQLFSAVLLAMVGILVIIFLERSAKVKML